MKLKEYKSVSEMIKYTCGDRHFRKMMQRKLRAKRGRPIGKGVR